MTRYPAKLSTLLVGAFLLGLALTNAASAATSILLADIGKIEASSQTFARLKTQAMSAQTKKLGSKPALTPVYEEALQQSLSEVRVSLPQVIAKLAQSKRADLVLEPTLAKKFALTGVDITSEVTQALDAQTAQLKFLPP
jgi:uncharacterized membrane protein